MKLKTFITAFAALAIAMTGLAALSGMTSVAVSDETEWYLYIEGHEIDATLDNSGNGWSWDSQAMTLTLEGYDSTAIYFDNYDNYNVTEYSFPVINIEVNGVNTISNTYDNQPVYGGYIDCALSATGASLNIKGTDKATDKLNIFNEFSTDYSNTIYCFTFDESNETIEAGSAISIDNVYLDIDTKSTHVIETSKFNTSNAAIEITAGICRHAIIDNYTYAENTCFDISMNVFGEYASAIYTDYTFEAYGCDFNVEYNTDAGDSSEAVRVASGAVFNAEDFIAEDCYFDFDYTNNLSEENYDASLRRAYFYGIDSYGINTTNCEFYMDVQHTTKVADLDVRTRMFNAQSVDGADYFFSGCTIDMNSNNCKNTYLYYGAYSNATFDNCDIDMNINSAEGEVYGVNFYYEDKQHGVMISNSDFDMTVTGTFQEAGVANCYNFAADNTDFTLEFGEDATAANGNACITTSSNATIDDCRIDYIYNATNSSDILAINAEFTVNMNNTEYNLDINGTNNIAAIATYQNFNVYNSTIKTLGGPVKYIVQNFGGGGDSDSIEYSTIECTYNGAIVKCNATLNIIGSVINGNSTDTASFGLDVESYVIINTSYIDIETDGFGFYCNTITFQQSTVSIISDYGYSCSNIVSDGYSKNQWVVTHNTQPLGFVENVDIPTAGVMLTIKTKLYIETTPCVLSDEQTTFYADDTNSINIGRMDIKLYQYDENANSWSLVTTFLKSQYTEFLYNIDANVDENRAVNPYTMYFTEYSNGTPTNDFEIELTVSDISRFNLSLTTDIARSTNINIDSEGLLPLMTLGTLYDSNGNPLSVGTVDISISLRGDANLDHVIDSRDAALISKYASDIAIGTENPVISAINNALAKIVADVNNDEVIDTRDASNVSIYSSKNANYVSGVPAYQKYIDIWTEIGCIE